MEPQNLVDLLSRAVGHDPSRVAQIYKVDGQWHRRTFQEFWDAIHHTALALRSLGIRPGDRVAIISHTRAEWVIADYAILALGAVTVPVYPSLKADMVEYILEDSGTRLVFAENHEQTAKIPPAVPAVVFDRATDHQTLEQLLAKGATKPKYPPLTWDAVTRETLATIVYTSGTTGLPKGVMLTHGNVLANIESIIALADEYPNHFKVRPDDVALSFLPLSHILERMTHGYLLASGATIAYAESIDTLADNLKDIRPTIMIAVPRVFEKVHARITGQVSESRRAKQMIFRWAIAAGQKKYRLELKERRPGMRLRLKLKIADRLVYRTLRQAMGGRLRLIVSGGAPLSQEIGEFFYAAGFAIYEGYGLTETAPVLTMNRPGHIRYGTVGMPVPNVELRIAPDGEILARGPNVMAGYWNLPEETEKALAGGWFHTGDIGQWNPDGSLSVTDRKKSLLVLSTGKNVAPAPIEQRLIVSSYIEQAVLVGDGRQYVTALLYVDPAHARKWAQERQILDLSYERVLALPDFQETLAHEIDRLTAGFAEFERPKRFLLLPQELTEDRGELTPSLKVKRNVVIAHYADFIDQLYHGDRVWRVASALEGPNVRTAPPPPHSPIFSSPMLDIFKALVLGLAFGVLLRVVIS